MHQQLFYKQQYLAYQQTQNQQYPQSLMERPQQLNSNFYQQPNQVYLPQINQSYNQDNRYNYRRPPYYRASGNSQSPINLMPKQTDQSTAIETLKSEKQVLGNKLHESDAKIKDLEKKLQTSQNALFYANQNTNYYADNLSRANQAINCYAIVTQNLQNANLELQNKLQIKNFQLEQANFDKWLLQRQLESKTLASERDLPIPSLQKPAWVHSKPIEPPNPVAHITLPSPQSPLTGSHTLFHKKPVKHLKPPKLSRSNTDYLKPVNKIELKWSLSNDNPQNTAATSASRFFTSVGLDEPNRPSFLQNASQNNIGYR